MTYPEAEARLLALPRFADRGAAAYNPGLDRMRALLEALGTPQDRYPSVHIAGTNGKGSTASMAAAIARASGVRVGLHTSPHLFTLRERMRVDGVPAREAWVADAVARIGDVLDAVQPSFFEATVALSLLHVAEAAVDLAVVEVGLGGRLDATNVLVPAVSAVTHIGLDHTDLLGETRPEIAREKAGIAKPGVPFLHAVADPEARAALENEAASRGATVEAVRDTCRADPETGGVRIVTPEADYGVVPVGLPGVHQAWNAALAARAAEVALDRLRGDRLAADAVRTGLTDVVRLSGLRGRGEAWAGDPRVTLDVAHNPDGWRAALGAMRVPEAGRLWALVGAMADKDADALAALLAASGARALVLGLPGERGLPADALTQSLRRLGVEATTVEGAAAGLRAFTEAAAPDDRLLATGSHLVVADVLGATP
ncbi:MAG: Mur ligase family protein [Bacteroidota bacterium]